MATLEEFASQYAPDQVTKVATDLRSTYPGKSDDDIIAIVQTAQQRSGTAPAETQPVPPQNAVAGKQLPPQATMEVNNIAKPGPLSQPPTRGDQYRIQNKMNEMQFGGAAEQAATDQGRQNNLYNEAGRNANLGLRAMVQAGGGSTSALDQDYKEQTAKANQPLTDLITQRDNAAKALEAQLRAGDIDAADARNQANKIGLESAQREAENKALYAAALQNPKSSTSLGLKQTAKDLFPDQIGKITGFENMTGAQLLTFLPMVEKNYLAQLANDGKVAAANAKAAGTPQVKVADAIRADTQVSKLQKEGRGVQDKAEGAAETVKLFDQMKTLIDRGLQTGPVVGGNNPISKVYEWASSDKQEAKNIAARLQSAMAKTFGAAPSDAESRLIKQANDVGLMDNPLPALAELRAKFEREIENSKSDLADIQNQQTSIRRRIGDEPMPANTPKVSPPMKNNSSGVPTVSTKAEAMALAPGTRFIGPDGNAYTR